MYMYINNIYILDMYFYFEVHVHMYVRDREGVWNNQSMHTAHRGSSVMQVIIKI